MSIRQDVINLDIRINGENGGKTYNELLQKSRDLNRSLKQLSPTSQEFAAKAKELQGVNTTLGDIRRSTAALGREMSGTSKIIGEITTRFLGFFAINKVIQLFGFAGNTLANFEQQMSKVQAVSNATDQDLDRLSEKAKELGATTSKSATEAAQGLEFLALAGYSVDQQLTALEPVLRLSEAGGIELARASDLATDALSALGLQASDLNDFLDGVTNTSTRSNTSIEQLTEAYIKVGGQLRNLNVPLNESNALLGIMANRGEKGSEAATGLNAILINLTTGAGQAGDAMREIGVSAFDSEGNFKGVSTVLNELNERFATMTQEQQNSYKAMIGGKVNVSTLNNLLSGMSQEFYTLRDAVSDSEGKLLDVAKTMQDNFQGKLTEASSTIEGLILQFGEKLIPVLTDIVSVFISFLRVISALPAFIKENRVAILSLVVALVSFNSQAIISNAQLLIYQARQKAAILWTTTWTAVQGALNTALRSNPIGIVIGAIALLVGALYTAYQRSATFQAAIAGLGRVAVEVFNIIKEGVQAFRDGWNAIKEGEFAEGLKKFGEGLKKTNPLTLAFGEGQRLGDAFSAGYKDKLDSIAKDKAAQKLLEDAAKANSGATGGGGGNEGGGGGGGGGDKATSKVVQDVIDDQIRLAKELDPEEILAIDQDKVDKQIEEYVQNRLSLLESGLDRELLMSERKFLEGLMTEEEYNMLRLEKKKQTIEEELSLLATAGFQDTDTYRQKELEKLNIENQISKERIDVAKREAEAKKQIQQGSMDAFMSFIDLAIDASNMETANKKKNAGAIKAFETARVFVNTAAEISGYYKQYSGIPGGIALAAILSGIALGRSALAISKINNQKFQLGDILRGPSHTNGGIPFTVGGVPGFEAEGGEAIINKRSTAVFRPVLSAINAFNGWGRRFEAGGLPGVSISPSSASVGSISNSEKLGYLESKFLQMVEFLSGGLDVKANVVYTELEAKGNTIAKLRSYSAS